MSNARTGALAAALVWTSLAAHSNAQDVIYSETFDENDGGWTAIDIVPWNFCFRPGSGSPRPIVISQSGGHPGGYIRHEDRSRQVDPLFRAPLDIGVDAGDAYGGFLRYSHRLTPGGGKTATWDDVYIQGIVDGEELTLIADSIGVPLAQWDERRVPLIEGVWTINDCFSPIATEAHIREVLENLTEIKIRAEHRFSDDDDMDIDNVMLIGRGPGPQSTFEFDGDGWGVVNDAHAGWVNSAGNLPQCFRGVDEVAGQRFFFAAPLKYLGNQSASLGATLEFDLRTNVDRTRREASEFVILAGGGIELEYRVRNRSIGDAIWFHHAIPLVPGGGWFLRGTDQLATQTDFDTVFADLGAMWIRGEYQSGNEACFIDNVVLGACSPSGVIDHADVEREVGQGLRLELAAAGRAPFAYTWMKDGDAIETAVNPSATSPVLQVESIQIADAGSYWCVVSNECGSVTTHEVAVRVQLCVADVDFDGDADIDDVNQFVERFLDAMTGNADIDGDGDEDIDDINAFVNAFVSGC